MKSETLALSRGATVDVIFLLKSRRFSSVKRVRGLSKAKLSAMLKDAIIK
jgi:hypothetical protein